MTRLALVLLAACGPKLVWHGQTPDRLHEVRIVDHHGQYVVVDGRRGPTFDAVAVGALAISPDSAHVAYAARKAGHWRMIIDGREGPDEDGIGEAVYSADSAHLAYAAEHAGTWRVIEDGRAGPELDSLLARSLQFSPDGRRLAYAGRRANGVHVVVDGVAGPSWTGVGELAFSADSQHVAYVARVGDIAVAVVDGTTGAGYEAIGELTTSATGGHVAYAAQRDGRWLAVIDGAESAGWDLVRGLTFSSDGTHVAYAARRDQGDTAVVVDGVAGASYRGVRPTTIMFPPAATQPTYVARRGDRFVVVHDGIEGPPFDDVRPPVFSANGSRWGYVGRFGDAWVPVIDGVESRSERWTSDLVFGGDGNRLAYLARRGADIAVIVNGVEHRFDIVLDGTLVFDRDGRHWGCVIGDRAERRFYFVVDGARKQRLEIDEAIDAAMRTKATGETVASNERALHDWVVAEVAKAGP